MPRTAAHEYAEKGDLNKLKRHLEESPNDINVKEDIVSSVYTNIIDNIYIINMNFINII